MKRPTATVLLSRSPGETRYALLDENDDVLEVAFHRATRALWGASYVGRVREKAPGHKAVLVDLGVGPLGFLADSESPGGLPTLGAKIPVQVQREAVGSKGPKLRVASVESAAAREAFDSARAPCVLPGDDPILNRWLSGVEVARLVCDDGVETNRLRSRPGVDVAFHNDPTPLFERYLVEVALEEALRGRIALPGGGALIVAETEALTAIDVDSGARSGTETARAAAFALARLIRLRALSGQIVVDFPRGRRGPDGDAVSRLKAALVPDLAKPRLLGVSRGGLVEIVRPRTTAPLSEMLLARRIDVRPSPETELLRIFRVLARGGAPGPEAGARRGRLRVGPAGSRLLDGPLKGAFEEARRRAALTIDVDVVLEDIVAIEFL